MSGIRFTIRTTVADISDNFNRANGALSGSTPVGARLWQIIGAGTAVPGIVSNTLKAISGTGNRIAVVNIGRGNYDFSYRIAATPAVTIVHSVALQATDESNYVAVNHRVDGITPGYVIARRASGVVSPVLSTGVVPMAGDFVKVRVRGGKNFTLIVNGVILGTAVVDGWEAKVLGGFMINGADTDTAFDDLEIVLR